MRLNPGYLLKSFLLYITLRRLSFNQPEGNTLYIINYLEPNTGRKPTNMLRNPNIKPQNIRPHFKNNHPLPHPYQARGHRSACRPKNQNLTFCSKKPSIKWQIYLIPYSIMGKYLLHIHY